MGLPYNPPRPAPSDSIHELRRDISTQNILVVITVAGSLCSIGEGKAWEVTLFMDLGH